MTRVVFLSSLLALLLAAAPAARAETAPDNDLGYTLPTDGLFDMPPDVTWTHDVVSFWWLVPMVFLSGAVLWIVKWIDEDARHVGLAPVTWNLAGIVLEILSLVAFILLPAWLSLAAVAAAFATLLWNYIPKRNAKVIPQRQLLTKEHREALKARFLKWVGIHPSGARKRLEKIAKTHVPVAVFDGSGSLLTPADAAFDPEDPMTTVREILGEAGRRHAREVELAPSGAGTSVSLVIDGLVHSGPVLDRVYGNAAMTVMKRTLVDPASETPQFRFQLPTLNRFYTARPFVYGEGSAEMMRVRLTPDGERMRRFAELGLAEEQAATVRSALDTGRGLIVVASPAGMGARTTMCAFLDTFDPFSRGIVTFERPVAGKLASIEQHEFADGASLAGLLHEALRKDPDVVMLSELPDAASAETALGAVPRDQLFLARIERPSTTSVPEYLTRLGASPDAIARGLHTLVAQRLVRRLCASCRRKVDPPAAMLQRIGVDTSHVEFVCEESAGCEECGHTGFHGRVGIFEVWQPSAESRGLIEQNAPADALHAAAVRDGMKSLQQSGLALVLEGATSLRELARALKVV